VPLASRLRNAFRRTPEPFAESTRALPAKAPERSGFEYGVPPGGLSEYHQGLGQATATDRRTLMRELYDMYTTCPWSWACVNAIARTVTAGGLVTDWDGDDGEGDQDVPDKPENVLALERLFKYCNPKDDIRQLMRKVIIDLLVFGDAFIEVVWIGTLPVALYNLDSPSMMPQADEHGAVSKYVQLTDFGQRAEFEPREVIHISLDAPRGGPWGVSPTQAALLPITQWLFAASNGKEQFRKGQPPTVHVDFPAGMPQTEINKWYAQYMQQNVGPKNLGRPLGTRGGAIVKELQTGRIQDVVLFKDQARDEIVSTYGVPPAKVGIIESGNLGSGSGEAQDKTYQIDTCDPIAAIVLEKINFHIVVQGFGIEDWHAKFQDVDYRSSQIVETIRDMRLRNGSWLLNRYRAEIGEPPVEGGDDAVLVDRQNILLWADIAAMSKAMVASKGAPAVAAGEQPPNGEPVEPQDEDPEPGTPVPERWMHQYRKRFREALRELPELTESRR
jgi:hypothetical protein